MALLLIHSKYFWRYLVLFVLFGGLALIFAVRVTTSDCGYSSTTVGQERIMNGGLTEFVGGTTVTTPYTHNWTGGCNG